MNPSCHNKTWYRDWRLLYSWILYIEFGGVAEAQKCKFCTFLWPLGGKICNKQMKRCLCLVSLLGVGGWGWEDGRKALGVGIDFIFPNFCFFSGSSPWGVSWAFQGKNQKAEQKSGTRETEGQRD